MARARINLARPDAGDPAQRTAQALAYAHANGLTPHDIIHAEATDSGDYPEESTA